MRSGREHCASRVAVEQEEEERRGGEEERRRGEEEEEKEEEEQAIDIKSNNPHLAGGERKWKNKYILIYGYLWILIGYLQIFCGNIFIVFFFI